MVSLPNSRLPLLLSGAALLMCALPRAGAQSFGLPLLHSKTTLQRKLPALVHLPGTTVRLSVSSHAAEPALADDFKTMLSSELLKDDPRMSVIDDRADSIVQCDILSFDHPQPTITVRPGVTNSKGQTSAPQSFTRVTGLMRVSFRARAANGATVGSDNVVAKYDEEFDSNGNAASKGVVGVMKNGWHRVAGGAKSGEDVNPPTLPELKQKLMQDAVDQIVRQLVTTREPIEVQLAKGKGAMDQGVKDAEAGLWSRALEAWETMPPLPKPVDDAYRLYDVGVAYEALGYGADDPKQAVTYLQKASTNYGKAIDSNPGEKYFIAPQKRIETALAHYSKLEAEARSASAPPAEAPSAPQNGQQPASGFNPSATTSSRSLRGKSTH
jgi:hypothetical protein